MACKMGEWRSRSLISALFISFSSLMFFAMFRNYNTMDQWNHLSYGNKMLKWGDTSRLVEGNSTTMPISMLHALPRVITARLGGDWDLRPDDRAAAFLLGANKVFQAWMAGRVVNILFALALALVAFSWSQRLYGFPAGLLTLTLCVFCPNLIAHGAVISTDLPFAAMAATSVYALWRWARSPTWARFAASAVTTGFLLLTKGTAIVLLPALAFLAAARPVAAACHALRARQGRAAWRGLARSGGAGVIYAAIVITVLNAGFLFDRSFQTPGEYRFHSAAFQGLQERFRDSRLPIPLPAAYLEGIDQAQYYFTNLSSTANLYLLGELQEGPLRTGWPYYFLVTFLLKVPLPALGIFAMAFWTMFRRSFPSFSDEAFLLVPAAWLFLYFSFFFKSQCGFRLVLHVLPFLYVWAGRLVALRAVKGGVLCALCSWLAVSSLSYSPFFLSYFNESIGSRKNAYLYLSDSNLQWGQATDDAYQWAAAHPGGRLNPTNDLGGEMLLDTHYLTGVWSPEVYGVIRDTYLPDGHVGYGYVVFHLPPSG